MKILFIYKEYKDRRKLYGKMMENLGHRVQYLFIPDKTKSNQVGVNDIKKYNPDLVWILNPFYVAYGGIDGEAMSYIKSKNIPIVLYGTFNVSVPYTEWIDNVWKKIDFLFGHSKEMCSWLQTKGINAHYMPLGFYPFQYYHKLDNKTIDVSFMGNCQTLVPVEKDKRSRYLQSLKDYNLIVYGKSFRDRLSGISVKSFNSHSEQMNVYSKTKVNLDFPFVNDDSEFYKNKYHFKNRFFEIPATGNFLLTVRCEEFLEIFDEDSVGYYDDNIESLKYNIDKYLRDDSLRNKMAEKACGIVHQKHTYEHRFKDMFRIING